MTPGHHPPSPPPDDQAGHPDLEVLADLDAGLPDPATAARLTGHVGGCASCAATLRTLEAVRADLRSLPAARLPDPVIARVDATLAQLRAGGAGRHSPGQVGGAPARSGRSGQPRRMSLASSTEVADLTAAQERRRDRSRRLTTLVAAIVVVLAAAIGVGTAVLSRSSSKSTINQATALSPDERTTPAGRTFDKGANPEASPGGNKGAAGDQALPAYTRLTLGAALPLIEQQFSVAAAEAADVRGMAGAMADKARRHRCSESIPGEVGQLRAVQQVLFEGRPGFVFVFAYDDAVHARELVVVGLDCGVERRPAVLYRWPD
jgi:hypothetical protein